MTDETVLNFFTLKLNEFNVFSQIDSLSMEDASRKIKSDQTDFNLIETYRIFSDYIDSPGYVLTCEIVNTNCYNTQQIQININYANTTNAIFFHIEQSLHCSVYRLYDLDTNQEIFRNQTIPEYMFIIPKVLLQVDANIMIEQNDSNDYSSLINLCKQKPIKYNGATLPLAILLQLREEKHIPLQTIAYIVSIWNIAIDDSIIAFDNCCHSFLFCGSG